MEKVFVCGAGHQGLSMAAHLALNGVEVTLWNRTRDNISSIIQNGRITCDGVVQGVARIARASDHIGDVISDFVMVTVPSSAHKDVAKEIAPYVHENMIIILNPGRTFGAVEFYQTLQGCGVKKMPHIAETQTIVYTCRKKGVCETTIYALKKGVKIAALRGSDIRYVMAAMPSCLRDYFSPVESVGEISLANVGMVLHCAPVLMNIGWIETDKADFKYYYDGISRSIASFLEKIDHERLLVARAYGVKVESLMEWLKRTYKIEGDNIFECIQNNAAYKEIDAPLMLDTRYIFEDVPNGLVPVEYLGKQLGVKTDNITLIINLACSVMNVDYRILGRKYDKSLLDAIV